MSVIQLLKQPDHFTSTEKRLADYILNHLDHIAQLTTTDLATATYTSHSAVIRLAKKLNFSGYKELKNALIKAALIQTNQKTPVNNNFPFDATASDQEVTALLANLTKNTITEIAAQLNTQTFSDICDGLLRARKILIYGQGDSQITGRSFQNKLVKLNKVGLLAEEYREEAWNTTNLTSADCALFISYGGQMRHYRKIMGYLKSQSVPTILLTGNPNSALLKFATWTLVTDNRETEFAKIAPFSSQVGFDFLLNSIYACMFKRQFKQNMIALQRRQRVIEEGILSDNV